MNDRGMGWLAALRRPSHNVTEPVNVETQAKVPFLKVCLGGLGYGVVFLALGYIVWLTPPDVAVDAGFMVMVGLSIVFAVIGLINVEVDISSRSIWLTPRAAYLFLLAILLGALAWYTSGLSYEWWGHEPIEHSGMGSLILYGIGVTFLSSGLLSAFWFTKEVLVMFELTGMDRVIYKKITLDDEKDQEIDRLQARIEMLEADGNEWEPQPLIRTDTDEGRHERARLKFQLATTQFLFIGAYVGFGRSAWVGQELPAGLSVTQEMWSHWCSRKGGQLQRRRSPVLRVDGNRTVINDGEYDYFTLAKMAMTATPPEGNNG